MSRSGVVHASVDRCEAARALAMLVEVVVVFNLRSGRDSARVCAVFSPLALEWGLGASVRSARPTVSVDVQYTRYLICQARRPMLARCCVLVAEVLVVVSGCKAWVKFGGATGLHRSGMAAKRTYHSQEQDHIFSTRASSHHDYAARIM